MRVGGLAEQLHFRKGDGPREKTVAVFKKGKDNGLRIGPRGGLVRAGREESAIMRSDDHGLTGQQRLAKLAIRGEGAGEGSGDYINLRAKLAYSPFQAGYLLREVLRADSLPDAALGIVEAVRSSDLAKVREQRLKNEHGSETDQEIEDQLIAGVLLREYHLAYQGYLSALAIGPGGAVDTSFSFGARNLGEATDRLFRKLGEYDQSFFDLNRVGAAMKYAFAMGEVAEVHQRSLVYGFSLSEGLGSFAVSRNLLQFLGFTVDQRMAAEMFHSV